MGGSEKTNMDRHEKRPASRRELLSLGTAAGGAFSLLDPQTSRAAEPIRPDFPVENVLKHGAAGDGATDDTAAFQRALDAAAKTRGWNRFSRRLAVTLSGKC